MTFDIVITGDYQLDLDAIWPDGGAPENPTAEDVAEVMRKYGSRGQVLDDWCLVSSVMVYGPGRSGKRAEVWP